MLHCSFKYIEATIGKCYTIYNVASRRWIQKLISIYVWLYCVPTLLRFAQ